MPLWSPSNIFTSLRQILKPSSVKSFTHTAMASWGLSGNWWLAVASTIGGVAKRFNEETKEMNELKDTEKKKEIYNPFITNQGPWLKLNGAI